MERLKKYWSHIVAVLFALLFFFGFQVNDHLSEVNELLLHQNDSAFTVAKHFHDTNGRLVQQVNMYEMDVKSLKKTGDALGFDNSKLKKQVGNLNNLIGYWRGEASASGNGVIEFDDLFIPLDSVDLLMVDTTFNWAAVQPKPFNWSDDYLILNGEYYPFDNEISFDYNYIIGKFELTAYRKKRTFKQLISFDQKPLVADLRFDNQNVKVSEFQGVVIKESKKGILERPLFWGGIGLLAGFFIAR